MALVLDYSAGQPGAAAIKAAAIDGKDVIGAARYIGFPDRRKCTTSAELRDFTAHGLGMALVYEDDANDWRGGFTRGRDAGRRARDHATVIGFPAGRPIYMAVDHDVVTDAEFATAVEYLRGASQTLGGVDLTGVYGEHDVCARAQQARVASWFWQSRAWSGTPVRLFAGRHLYQRVGTVRVGGIGCDINDVLREDWGQHTMEDTVSWDDTYTLTRADTGQTITVSFGDMLANVYQMTFYGSGSEPWKGPSIVGHLKTLVARAVADVDEQALADALAAHGVVGITPAQVKAAVQEVFARAGTPDGSVILPNLVGSTPQEARNVLAALGWTGDLVDQPGETTDPDEFGKITSQSPPAGTSIASDADVTVVVATQIGTGA